MTITEAQMMAKWPDTFPATFPLAVLTDAIAESALRMDREQLGDLADVAQIYLAAHIALMDQRAQGEGISSATAGPVSVVFDRAFRATSMLEEYNRVLRGAVIPVGLGCW